MPLPKPSLGAADAQGNVWDSSAGEWVPSTSCGRDLEERAAANRERSARRAKTQVRRLIKAKNLDTMLTLTYRENMTDRGAHGARLRCVHEAYSSHLSLL